MSSREYFNVIVRGALLRADNVAMELHPTTAAKTKAIVEATLEMVIGNGLMEMTDPDTWPEWFTIDPPYGKEI